MESAQLYCSCTRPSESGGRKAPWESHSGSSRAKADAGSGTRLVFSTLPVSVNTPSAHGRWWPTLHMGSERCRRPGLRLNSAADISTGRANCRPAPVRQQRPSVRRSGERFGAVAPGAAAHNAAAYPPSGEPGVAKRRDCGIALPHAPALCSIQRERRQRAIVGLVERVAPQRR